MAVLYRVLTLYIATESTCSVPLSTIEMCLSSVSFHCIMIRTRLWKSDLFKFFLFLYFVRLLVQLTVNFPFTSQVKWRAWPSFRTLMVTGLRSWVLTIWCPLLPKNCDNMLLAAVHTGQTCCRFTGSASLAKNLATCAWDVGNWSWITCTMAITVPWNGLD